MKTLERDEYSIFNREIEFLAVLINQLQLTVVASNVCLLRPPQNINISHYAVNTTVLKHLFFFCSDIDGPNCECDVCSEQRLAQASSSIIL